MPLEACLQAAYDFMSEHRAKPVSEMKQSGIELSAANLWYNVREGIDAVNRAKPANKMMHCGYDIKFTTPNGGCR